MEGNEVNSYMLVYLSNLKNEILRSKDECNRLATGYLVSAHYIDKAINTIMGQQTEIASLESELEIERGYSRAWGDFFGYTPQEMTVEERKALRRHMKRFEDRWKKE